MIQSTEKTLSACGECDLLIKPVMPNLGEKSTCPRCGSVLQSPRQNSVERTFALSLAGIALFFPAMFLPMIGIRLLGDYVEVPLWRSVSALYEKGMWLVAVLVLLASLVFPFIKILFSLLVSGHLYFGRTSAHLADWMRWIHHMHEWAMLEVYTLGIIVAVVKLTEDAEVFFGLGLYSFAALLIVMTMLSASIDESLFWDKIGDLAMGKVE